MTTEETTKDSFQEPEIQQKFKNGRVVAGSILVVVGGIFLARQLGVDFPRWLFNWQVFLIVLGLFIGAKHNFRTGGWWIVSLVGVVFLINQYFPGVGHLFWPLVIILVGLVFIFKPKSKWDPDRFNRNWSKYSRNNWSKSTLGSVTDDGDYIDSTSIFGGNKKIVVSKNFKGGEITSIFGGSEINLIQADINGVVMLEVTQLFGGIKLLVPANWVVKSEMVAIFGSVEDKRHIQIESTGEEKKVLFIEGTSIFGGIDIRSY